MRYRIPVLFAAVSIFSLLMTSSCGGPKAFTKGEYDDPERVELLDDKFNEADMQAMSQTIVDSITACPEITDAKKKPTVIVDLVKNNTEEHIDIEMLTDKIRTALSKKRTVKFIDKSARETMDEEYRYNEAGNVAKEKMKSRGKQTGADYLMRGALATNVQQVGNDKFIYYKLTMHLTNVETSEIDCTEEKEIRKKYRKQTF